MRALFSFDEAMSPALFGVAFRVVSAFIALFVLLGVAAIVTTLNTVNIFQALLNAAAVIGAGIGVVLVLRLLAEIWMSQLRIQDRLNILVEQGRERHT